MNIEKFTEKSQLAIQDAQSLAIRMGNQEIDGEHLHFSLLTQEEGLIPRLINYMGINLELYKNDLQSEIEKLPKVSGSGATNLYATRRFNELLLKAEDEAKVFKDEYVGVEHIYISLVKEKSTPSTKLFQRQGITHQKFLEALSKVRSNQRIQSKNPEETYEALAKFGRNLVDMAKDGNLDPVIGRDEEIRRVIRILS